MRGYKKKLAQLENYQNELRIDLQGVQADIEDLKLSYELPKLRKKIEGKYFRYINSYSSSEVSWYLYMKVLSVADDGRLNVLSFETDCYDKMELKIDTVYYSKEILKRMISKSVFKKAYKETVLHRLNQI